MAILDRKLEELCTRIAETRRFHKELSGYRGRCAEALETGAACPLIDEVSHPDQGDRTG